METFKPAYGIETHYEVSDLGNIRRSVGGQGSRIGRNFAKPATGYHSARVCIEGKPSTVAVHRLVAQTFLRPMTKGECVNHLDGNPLNNSLNNLEITSYSGNSTHAVNVLGWKPTAQRGEANGCALITEAQARIAKYEANNPGDVGRLAAEWGVKKSTLFAIRCGRNWRHI